MLPRPGENRRALAPLARRAHSWRGRDRLPRHVRLPRAREIGRKKRRTANRVTIAIIARRARAASNYRKLKFRSHLAPAVCPPREIMRVANRWLACAESQATELGLVLLSSSLSLSLFSPPSLPFSLALASPRSIVDLSRCPALHTNEPEENELPSVPSASAYSPSLPLSLSLSHVGLPGCSPIVRHAETKF